MKTFLQNAPCLPVLLALAAFALPVVAGAQKEKAARFPNIQGENLEKKSFRLPQTLQGDLNIVILAFEREQQTDIDTWLPAVRSLCATAPYLRYYEVPVIQKTTKQAETFINQGMYQGIPAKSDREKTITIYTDRKKFQKKLGIENAAAIHVLLIDRKGVIVWRGAGLQTPEKAAALTSATQNWAKAKGPRIETLSGRPASLADFRGKTVFLVLSAQGPAKAAGLLLQEVLVGSATQGNIVYASGADLTGAPGVLRGVIRDGIKDAAKKDNARLVAALKQAGIAYTPQIEPVTLLDWQGILARDFAVSGQTERAYQVFVLNKEGKTVFQHAQQKDNKNAPSPAPQIIRALREAETGAADTAEAK